MSHIYSLHCINSVTEVVLCKLDDQVKFVAQQGFSLWHKAQTGSGTHSAANSMGTRVFPQGYCKGVKLFIFI